MTNTQDTDIPPSDRHGAGRATPSTRAAPAPRRVFGLACAASILAACASATYNFETEELVLDPEGLAGAASFAFYEDGAGDRTDADEGALPPAVDQEVRDALGRELVERGWAQRTSRDAADVVVAYTITSAESSRLVSDIAIGRYATVREDAARELAYVDQALVVDLFSWPAGENIWRGRAIARLYSPLGETRAEVIDQAVARIVAQLDDDL